MRAPAVSNKSSLENELFPMSNHKVQCETLLKARDPYQGRVIFSGRTSWSNSSTVR